MGSYPPKLPTPIAFSDALSIAKGQTRCYNCSGTVAIECSGNNGHCLQQNCTYMCESDLCSKSYDGIHRRCIYCEYEPILRENGWVGSGNRYTHPNHTCEFTLLNAVDIMSGKIRT